MLGPNRFYRGEFVDPWALGVLAYELVVGDTPFNVDDHESEEKHGRGAGSGGSNQVQQGGATVTRDIAASDNSSSIRKKNTVDRIFDNIRNFREVELPIVDVDEDYVDLVQGFLQVEPMHRRLAGDCLIHAFFQKALSNRGTCPASSAAGQKENMQNHSDSRTTAAPTVSQRCKIWNKQKQFGHWPGSEHEI
jgi:serine/threonine protein kinase